MNSPSNFIAAAAVADMPLDYEWDMRIQNRFYAADADSKPKLAKALDAISDRASFALCVAYAEWVVARLSKHADVSDAKRRLQLAWEAVDDPGRDPLAEPAKLAPEIDRRTAGPVRQAMMLLSFAHQAYVADNVDALFVATVGLGMLADHVAGRNKEFKRWSTEVMKRLQESHPASKEPFRDQPAVARDLFAAA